MESQDLALPIPVATAITVLAAALFDALTRGFQVIHIIGIGTTIGLAMSAYSILNQRKEGKWHRTDQLIMRLKPTVYDPLLQWAAKSAASIDALPSYEIWNSVSSPPDVSEVPDYIAKVGDILKKMVSNIRELWKNYYRSNNTVQDEYRKRIQSITSKLNPRWKGDSLIISLRRNDANRSFNVSQFGGSSRIELTREWLQVEGLIALNHNSEPTGTVECPKEMLELEAITYPETLSSFNTFRASRDNLRNALEPFITELSKIIASGEKDWKI